jgi:hypothetical protein
MQAVREGGYTMGRRDQTRRQAQCEESSSGIEGEARLYAEYRRKSNKVCDSYTIKMIVLTVICVILFQ